MNAYTVRYRTLYRVLLTSGYILVSLVSVPAHGECIVMGCNTKETQIYKLKDLSITKEVHDKSFIAEVFIIANPPEEKEKLRALIKSFNDSTLIADSAEKMLLNQTRTFYRETRDLNEKFKEKDPSKEGYFAKVDLSGYYQDKVMISRWEVGNTGIAGSYLTLQLIG